MTETLGNTPSNVEAKILFDALAFKLFDRESKTVKIHSGRCDDRGTLLAHLYKKKTALNVQTTTMKGEQAPKNVQNTGRLAG